MGDEEIPSNLTRSPFIFYAILRLDGSENRVSYVHISLNGRFFKDVLLNMNRDYAE